jgi:phosphoserine aminotransferase
MLSDPELPAGAPVVVGDATSTLFSRPIDVAKYGILYASAGKNFGPAGMCVIIVRSDLLDRKSHPLCPALLDYRESAFSQPISSIYNTPPCFQLYMSAKVWELQKADGGMSAMATKAIRRSDKIYKIFDSSDGFYTNNIDKASRSRMNLCFRIRDSISGDAVAVQLEKRFVSESEAAGLFQLFGHPVYGGLRVTIYNGQEDSSVDAVAIYLNRFYQKYKDCTDLASLEKA